MGHTVNNCQYKKVQFSSARSSSNTICGGL